MAFRKQAKADKAAAQEAARRAAQTQYLAAEARIAFEAWDAAKLDTQKSVVEGVVMKKGEVAYGALDGAGYVEPKRPPATGPGDRVATRSASPRASTTGCREIRSA